LSAYFSRSPRETLLARLSWRSNSSRWSSFSPVSCSPWTTLSSWFAFRSLRAGHLARLTLSRFGSWWQLVTSFSFHRVWIAGHDHPLQVNCLGCLALHHLADQDLPIQVDPAVNQLQWLLADRLAVDIEQDFVTEDTKVELVPLSVKHLWNIPGQGLQLSVEVQDRKLHSLPRRVETNSKLWAPLCVGDPDEVPRIGARSTIPESCDKAELLWQSLVEDSQCVHPQVGGGVNPVGRLHFVGTTHPGNAGVSIKVYIKLKLPDEIKRLKVIITRLIISTWVGDFLCIAWPSGLEHLHSCTFLCCSSSGSWPPSCGCGWSSCRCWWGWSGLGEHKTGIVCVLISGDLLNSQFPVLLPDPLLRPVGSLEACIAGKEAIVPDVEAALSSRRLHTEVDHLHPHLFSSGAKEHSRCGA